MGKVKFKPKRRQVSFCKQRSGLGAHDDVDVALIVFSNEGKLSEISIDATMERILERHERCSYSEGQLTETDHESQAHGSRALQHAKLKSTMEVLQTTQRHIMGEGLDSVSLEALQNLEEQLDAGLKRIRLTRDQLLLESISVLKNKNEALKDENSSFLKKIKEEEKNVAGQVLDNQQDCHSTSSYHFDTYISAAYQAGGDESVEESLRQAQCLNHP